MIILQLVVITTATQTNTQYQEVPATPHIILGAVGDIILHKELQARLPDGYNQILRLWAFGSLGLKDCGMATTKFLDCGRLALWA